MSKKIYLFIEFTLLFFGIPLFIFLDKDLIHPSIFLIPAILIISLILKYDTKFRLKELIAFQIRKADWIIHGIIVTATAILLLVGTTLFERENLFNLPRANLLLFISMCFFYPLFSAFSQEVIYRTYLYRRYNTLFNTNTLFIIASSVSFSFMHIVYYSPVSILLTLGLGLYLAQVYLMTRSVLFTAILHSILGILVFAVGLGHYFWLDMPV